MRALAATLTGLLAACGAPPACPCDEVPLPASPITDEAGLRALLDEARPILFPDLAEVTVALRLVADLQYFRAFVDLATVGDPPLERTYAMEVDPAVFDDPPSNAAFLAVVAHELGHVHDYVGMDAEALVAFAVFYAAGDVADYERATDEQALERGCAAGLSEFRVWLYDHTEGAVLEEKRRDYYSPREIARWERGWDGCP